ncbi:hypothetical protein B0H14DRAFT_2603875 [Mycena olivaceomarginata]|nr:hypothetical protein B0H14DRAFT_2603875 [Mycena olivaceomarginata]
MRVEEGHGRVAGMGWDGREQVAHSERAQQRCGDMMGRAWSQGSGEAEMGVAVQMWAGDGSAVLGGAVWQCGIRTRSLPPVLAWLAGRLPVLGARRWRWEALSPSFSHSSYYAHLRFHPCRHLPLQPTRGHRRFRHCAHCRQARVLADNGILKKLHPCVWLWRDVAPAGMALVLLWAPAVPAHLSSWPKPAMESITEQAATARLGEAVEGLGVAVIDTEGVAWRAVERAGLGMEMGSNQSGGGGRGGLGHGKGKGKGKGKGGETEDEDKVEVQIQVPYVWEGDEWVYHCVEIVEQGRMHHEIITKVGETWGGGPTFGFGCSTSKDTSLQATSAHTLQSAARAVAGTASSSRLDLMVLVEDIEDIIGHCLKEIDEGDAPQ